MGKRKWFALLLPLCSASAWAQSTMQVHTGDLQATEYSVTEDSKLQFSGRYIVFTNGAEQHWIETDDIVLITFDASAPDGIVAVGGGNDNRRAYFAPDGHRLVLKGFEQERTVSVFIFTPAGQCVHRYTGKPSSAGIAAPALPKGNYIILVNNRAFKCMKP